MYIKIIVLFVFILGIFTIFLVKANSKKKARKEVFLRELANSILHAYWLNLHVIKNTSSVNEKVSLILASVRKDTETYLEKTIYFYVSQKKSRKNFSGDLNINGIIIKSQTLIIKARQSFKNGVYPEIIKEEFFNSLGHLIKKDILQRNL